MQEGQMFVKKTSEREQEAKDPVPGSSRLGKYF